MRDVTPAERCVPPFGLTDGSWSGTSGQSRIDRRAIRSSRAFRAAFAVHHVPPSKRELMNLFFPLSPDLETPTEVYHLPCSRKRE